MFLFLLFMRWPSHLLSSVILICTELQSSRELHKSNCLEREKKDLNLLCGEFHCLPSISGIKREVQQCPNHVFSHFYLVLNSLVLCVGAELHSTGYAELKMDVWLQSVILRPASLWAQQHP